MRRFAASATVVLAATLVLLPAPAAFPTHQAGGDLLPDLQTLELDNFSVSGGSRSPRPGGGSSEQRLLFDNEVMNLHTGPLEVHPTGEKCTTGKGAEGRIAKQRIYEDALDSSGTGDGGFIRGVDTVYREVEVGCMTFHAQHRHWHFDDFALFELKGLDSVTGAYTQDVAESLKMTFCIADVNRRAERMSTADAQFSPANEYYNQCSRNSAQGLSVGWGDLYPNGTTGQYIDITAVPNGEYCFVSTANPNSALEETDPNNNVESTFITLSTVDGKRTVVQGDPNCFP